MKVGVLVLPVRIMPFATSPRTLKVLHVLGKYDYDVWIMVF